MLNFNEFKKKLLDQNGPHWMNAYVDEAGTYWVQGNGGMGTTIFKKLDSAHPFNAFIVTLLESDFFQRQPFQSEYEAGEVLSRLLPNAKVDSNKQTQV